MRAAISSVVQKKTRCVAAGKPLIDATAPLFDCLELRLT